MELEQEITIWDGKSADDIKEIYLRHAPTPSFIPELTQLMAQESTQVGATWLLKRHLEDKQTLTQADINAVYQHLPLLVDWEAKLHVLQSIPFMPIPLSEANQVYSFLQACVADQNKFVRAWAYNGFYELARQHLDYQVETRQLFETAVKDEAPSVKARIRHILKKDAKGTQLL